MAASIIDTLKQLITQGPASTLADKLGEDPQSVTRGLQAASTSIFAGLANQGERRQHDEPDVRPHLEAGDHHNGDRR